MDEFPLHNQLPKYVVSTTLTRPGPKWPAEILQSTDDVARLKTTDGGPIIVHGSGTLAQSLAAADLVDRYHLLTFPVLLGHGKRLFATDDGRKRTLHLTEHADYDNGIQLSVYQVEH